MDKQKKPSEFVFDNDLRHLPLHSRIIQQNKETLIVEEENTIYEIDKECAFRRGYMKKRP